LTLSCSLGLLTLWSIVTLVAVMLSMQRTALVSPKLAMWQVLLPPDFLMNTRQHVDPVSLAPTSLSCSSALAQTLSKTSLMLFFSLAYYCSKSCFKLCITFGITLAQYYETSPPPCPSRMPKRPLPSLSILSSIMYSGGKTIMYGLP